MTNIQDDVAFQSFILQGVSRTFALTIPQLPPALNTVVGNGYLLCRIADTIEDEPTLSFEQKTAFSQQFIQVVAGKEAPQSFSDALVPLLSTATLEAERVLITNTPRVIRLTHSFSYLQQRALLRCVRIMATGMAQFQRNSSIQGLTDLEAMNQYCYYVAGVVGEMLTELFCDYSPQIAKSQTQLQKLALSFGQGLQMTNILKDIWDDYQRGVCWLPRDIFAQFDFDLGRLSELHPHPNFRAGLKQLIGIAHGHLYQALQYIFLIPRDEKGIRHFCLWALGMAVLTLRKIHAHLDFQNGQTVKISRRSVKSTILVTNLLTRSDRGLALLFYLLTRGLPPKIEEARYS